MFGFNSVNQIEKFQDEISDLQAKVSELQSKAAGRVVIGNHITGRDAVGFGYLLFGIFCAWWAQHTNRNPWVWFFMGLIFNFITGFVLLYKNACDKVMRHGSAAL